MLIDATELDKVFRDCLYKAEEVTDGKPPDGCVVVEGVVRKFGLHPARLEAHREQVKTWLLALPEQFQVDKGGGWSFLQACDDREGQQWGEHMNMEQLFCLGIGLGMVASQMPRDLWPSLPGGMPYYCVDVTRHHDGSRD